MVGLALVVPALEMGGGVPAAAAFVKKVAQSSGVFDVKLVSLSMSSREKCGVRLASPSSWLRGAGVRHGEWQGTPFVHVGAVFEELEFQRYRPRRALTQALEGCDIVQVVSGSPAWANAVCGLGKPVSLHCATRARLERRRRDARPEGVIGWWRKSMTEITDRIDDRALRVADAIQVMNPGLLEYARALNHDRPVDLRYAPPGIDARTFSPAGERDLASDPYVLCVGRLDDSRKNIPLLLDAMEIFAPATRQELRLVLAGQAAPDEVFWRRAEARGLRGRIDFVHRPSTEELVSLYRRATVFALSSDEEGFGVVVLEAMACGIPVVSTRSGGPDGIITDGEDGFLVPLDDAAALAERITRLHLDRQSNIAMGRAARATVERRFSEERAGEVFRDIWSRLLEQPKGVMACAG